MRPALRCQQVPSRQALWAFHRSFSLAPCTLFMTWPHVGCREVKERMKKTRQDKAAAKAAETKKTGGKATKNIPRSGPGKVGGKR